MAGTLLTNARLATMVHGADPYGLIENAAIAIDGDRIDWAGPIDDLPDRYRASEAEDIEGRLVTPGLIDCHTHIVYGGNRAREFEQRLGGATYEEIARAGGGILSTVNATRGASEEELLAGAMPRVKSLIGEGVTTLEIKSGYGLDTETELKMLRVAREIGRQLPIRVRTSFLGAHAFPAGARDNPDRYIEDICMPAMTMAAGAGLADAVDGFCENIAFSPRQIARVFDHAKTLDLPVKLHAEQLSNSGGAALAASYGALSADHLEYLDEDGARAMAGSGTVGVLLPGAFYTLRETKHPPVDLMRRLKVPMAVATDCNPGSSPLVSLLLALNMACTLFRLTPHEALAGATTNAARALALDDCGILTAGMRADLAVWDVGHPAELAYHIGFNPLHTRYFAGLKDKA